MESVCGLAGKAAIPKAACAIWAILRFSGENWLLAPGIIGTTSTPVLDWADCAVRNSGRMNSGSGVSITGVSSSDDGVARLSDVLLILERTRELDLLFDEVAMA